ncbi:MAG: FAD-dependent oxidoreductase [Cyanobacteria bacterium CRU_2_1]|nr:FAD-dependent oxidoreductase [Cyanobacteria bacterium RU_5_0]NJR58728.1 FAD-dependent oxidoreductase [Cyanobacteria bacterium CRU_2_1]
MSSGSSTQPTETGWDSPEVDDLISQMNGRPQLNPLPTPQEIWECEVVVVGGSLGGVAAASEAMQAGAKTCLIELSPWLGGQISSQGVSAIDESQSMRSRQNFAPNWLDFKYMISGELVKLPSWTNLPSPQPVQNINSCWVGTLCFPPEAGAMAARDLLQISSQSAPGSRWETSTAFKGAEFDVTGQEITAVYGVRRIPRNADYMPLGRPSVELASWYSWSADNTFDKVPIWMQPPPGKRMIVIDATDTGELVGWANIPYRLGSESKATTGETHASRKDNPQCTQGFTFPFALALRDDSGTSLATLAQIEPEYSRREHEKDYSLGRFPMFIGGSFFQYRRIVSTRLNNPYDQAPAPGDITMVNWNRGNDWVWMDPPLILTDKELEVTGQYQNWMGGVSLSALKHAEEHALLFAEWLMKTQAEPRFPLALLSGPDTPMNTISGLSMMPYIREGRRILGQAAYGQDAFMLQEEDLRADMVGRDFSATVIGLTHYSIDIHGCRYRDHRPSWEASSAPVEDDSLIRPTQIPLEALIPQGVDNVLVGGKGIAATHIANASTRVHYGEWVIGSAAGGTAGWLIAQDRQDLAPEDIITEGLTLQLQEFLMNQGLRLDW